MGVPVIITQVHEPIAALPCEPVFEDRMFPALSDCMAPLFTHGGNILWCRRERGEDGSIFRVTPVRITIADDVTMLKARVVAQTSVRP